jgi:hypothetical protein
MKFTLLIHEYFYQSYILSYGPEDAPAQTSAPLIHMIRKCRNRKCVGLVYHVHPNPMGKGIGEGIFPLGPTSC